MAVVPPVGLRADLEEMKVAFSRQYSARHALKSPPHVTLLPPFRENEGSIIPNLETVAGRFSPFDITLENYGAFKPRVIYIDVLHSEELNQLRKTLVTAFEFDYDTRPFRPHLTLATRDLSKAMFHKAWSTLQHQSFNVSFHVDRIYLLKHNGKNWDLYRDFPLLAEASPK